LVIASTNASRDDTTAVARSLPRTEVYVHAANRGYDANQKYVAWLLVAHLILMTNLDTRDNWRAA
jgi:hypothetical protein